MATPVLGFWPAPFPPPSGPSLAKGYAQINSDGSIFLQQGGWLDSVDHPATGRYVLHINILHQDPQNGLLATVQFLSPNFLGAQFSDSATGEVDTWDATGAAADRAFVVALLGP